MLRHAHSRIICPLAIVLASLLVCSDGAAVQPSRAIWSERLIDSVGVNVHLHYEDTPYGKQWEQVRDALIHSGIRHIRDGLVDTTWQPYYDRLNELGRAGIGVTLVSQWDQRPELLRSYPSRVRRIDAYEAPNETDVSSGTADWAQRLRTFQRTLWHSAKTLSHPLPVIGPSLTSEAAYASLGDLSAFEDFGNMHDYLGGHNPENNGWGLRSLLVNQYGSIPYNIRIAAAASSKRPIIATETGYTDAPQEKQGIPENIVGRYAPRSALEHLRAGVSRTFVYELVDEGGTGAEGKYGLLAQDLRPKSSFLALRSLLQAMKDPGAAFTPGVFDVDIQPETSDIHWIVFEKRTHDLIIALWRAAASYDVDSRTLASVPGINVRLSVHGYSPQEATARVFSDEGLLVPEKITASRDAAGVAVYDRVTLLSFPHQKPIRRSSQSSRGIAI